MELAEKEKCCTFVANKNQATMQDDSKQGYVYILTLQWQNTR